MKLICGVDEAGRGPLAGPVTASAVILPDSFPVFILSDSKKMTPLQRKKAAKTIRNLALDYSTGWCWPEEIDRINIHRATLLCMKRAVSNLRLKPALVLVDGLFVPEIPFPCTAIVRGDNIMPQIQAAAIIAKTTRDLWMERYARIEPLYNFEKHKGYPTKEHRVLLINNGPSAIHRNSFHVKDP